MKILVLEDEKPILEVILSLLSLEDGIEEIVSTDSISKAYDILEEFSPDLALLDVSLKDGNSFDLLEKLGTIDFKIIFITSHKETAVEAFKVNAIDFITKPVSPKEFKTALEKVRNILKQEINFKKADLLDAYPVNRKIILNASDKIHILLLNDIVRCQADGNYTHIYSNDRKIMVTKKIKEIEELLGRKGFMRCHTSHIVNLNCITEIDKRLGNQLIMTDGSMVPVSRQNKADLLKALAE